MKLFLKSLTIAALLASVCHATPVRYVQISTNAITQQSGSINISGATVSTATILSGTITASSATVTYAVISTTTISSATVTGASFTNVSISSMTSTLPMSGRKITGLANGSAATDAAAFGQITAATPGQIVGTSTNDNATAGNVGEYISSAVITNTNFPTSAQEGDGASISLTAGDWDVSAVLYATINGATMVYTALGISQTAGNSTTGLQLGTNWIFFLPPSATSDSSASIPSYRQSLSTTTSIYLKVVASYSVAIPKFECRLSARRVR